MINSLGCELVRLFYVSPFSKEEKWEKYFSYISIALCYRRALIYHSWRYLGMQMGQLYTYICMHEYCFAKGKKKKRKTKKFCLLFIILFYYILFAYYYLLYNWSFLSLVFLHISICRYVCETSIVNSSMIQDSGRGRWVCIWVCKILKTEKKKKSLIILYIYLILLIFIQFIHRWFIGRWQYYTYLYVCICEEISVGNEKPQYPSLLQVVYF